MDFEFYYTSTLLVKVVKLASGGCGEFSATFPTMEEAQDFVIRMAALNGDLPKEIKNEIF